MFQKPKQLICTQCGNTGKPQRKVKGNLLIEIILWLFFILPGLIYSIWRTSSYYKACKVCGSTTLIPLDSPLGKKTLKELSHEE